MSSVQGNLTDAYVSSVDFLHTRDIYDYLFDRYEEDTLIDFFERTGRKHESEQTTWRHFEKDYIYQTIQVAAKGGTPGVGNDVLITLETVNHDNGQSYPKVTDLVLFKDKTNGYVIAKDTTAPTAHIITVRPVDTVLGDVQTATVVGEIVAFHSNAHAEGSDQPEGVVHKPLRFEGIHQIFKTHVAITGSEATNRIEYEFEGKQYYMFQAEHDAYQHHKMDAAFGFLFNVESDGLTNAAGEEVRVSKGLAEWIRGDGNIFASPIASLADIDTIIKTLDKQRGSKENLWLNGINLDIDTDNVLIDKFLSGAIQYNTFGSGNPGKDQAIKLGFNSFKKGSYTFHKKQLDEFNHANVSGATAHTWPDTGFIIPTDVGRDAKSGNRVDSIAMRWKKAPHMDREYIHVVSGILADKSIGTVDEIGFEYISEKSLEVFGLNRFVLLEQ